VAYFQLAHNVRNPRTGKPVAQISRNFGPAGQVDRDSLIRLCRSLAPAAWPFRMPRRLPVGLPRIRRRCPVA